MHSSKIVQVLKKFTKKEIRQLKRFLNTPSVKYNGRVKGSLDLFKIISAYHPHFKSTKLDKENVFKKLYPGAVYRTGKLEKEMSRLFVLIEAFIVDSHSGSSKDFNELLTLAAFYRDKALPALSEISVRKYRKLLQQTEQKDSMYLYHVFSLEKQIVNDQTILLYPQKKLGFLPDVLETLDQYYILEKLELACRLLAIHRFLFPVEFKKSLLVLEHLLPLLESGFFEHPAIKVFYKAYFFLKAKEADLDKKFLAFEKELKHQEQHLPDNQVLTLHAMIRNYYITQYHKGKPGFLKKSFYIYRVHLEKGFLYYEGRLFASTMMNMVVSGLLLKEFDWVLQFILEHEHKISGTSSPKEVYQLNLANYYFHIVNYEKALDYLRDNYEDIYFKLRAKRMEIKIYYEMNHILLEPKMDAFKIYIHRFTSQKITQKYKEGNRKFIDLLKQITLSRTFQNQKRIDKLIAKIKQLKFILENEWLLEKLEALR